MACSDAHEALRDATEQALAAADVAPVPPEADYPQLYPVPDAGGGAQAGGAARGRLRRGLALPVRRRPRRRRTRAAGLRTAAQDALTASAVRATQWRYRTDPAHATTPFPGV